MNIEKALEIAIQAHKGQVDKAGKAYILHPLRLMSQFENEKLMIISILHDVVEDTYITLGDLVKEGFSTEIVNAIDCITKRNNEDYSIFIDRVSSNSLSKQVKITDIKDNLDISRLSKPLNKKDIERLEKYQIALLKLTN